MFLIINLYKFCTVYGKVFMNNIFLEMEVTMPILADQHLHSSFSGDSDEKMLDMIEEGIEKGLKSMTFTEHMDLHFPVSEETPEGIFELNTDSYLYDLLRYRAQYEDKIKILFGVELGLQPEIIRENLIYLKNHEFDFVIGSSHICNGKDPYYPAFYEGRSEREALEEYFNCIIANIDCFSNFDVYGHLDYIVRYCPSKGSTYSYFDYSDLIDTILKKLLAKEKGIEVNTGDLFGSLNAPNPCKDIIARYFELGGEIITVGSDAHNAKDIASGFDVICGMLKEIGFKYYSVFENRLPEYKRL